MTGGPCPDHPQAATIGGHCGMCTIKPGSLAVEILPYPYETGCKSTIHCANFGFCDRCSPELAKASAFVLQAMSELDRATDGQLYEDVMNVLKKAVL